MQKNIINSPKSGMELEGSSLGVAVFILGGGGGGGGRIVAALVLETTGGRKILLLSRSPLDIMFI